MAKNSHIFIVDDEPANCRLLEQALAAEYATTSCESAAQCLQQLNNIIPDIILLDVMMPKMNGYELCLKIKQQQEYKDIAIIFVSALDTIEDHIKGYDAGGNDYLGKPVDITILLNKVKLLLEQQKAKQQLAKEVAEIQTGFMTALTMGYETGQVSSFIEQCLVAKTYQQLLHAFFGCMKDFNLNTVAQIRDKNETNTVNSNAQSLPLEHKLMLKVQYEGRIKEFGERIFINYPSFSILVKNFPVDNPDLVGRLRDHLVVIAKACDYRIKSIYTEQNLKAHLDSAEIFKQTLLSVNSINQSLEQSNQKALTISQTMAHQIEEKLLFLGLEEDQEKELMGIIDKSTKDLVRLIDKQSDIKEALEYISHKMKNALTEK